MIFPQRLDLDDLEQDIADLPMTSGTYASDMDSSSYGDMSGRMTLIDINSPTSDKDLSSLTPDGLVQELSALPSNYNDSNDFSEGMQSRIALLVALSSYGVFC